MVAGNVSQILRVPGRIVIDPTDLSAAYPHGGTEVGHVKMVVIQEVGNPPLPVVSELLAEPIDVLDGDNEWVCSFFVRGWDDDAVQQLLPGGYSAGSVSGHSLFSVPGSRTPGQSAIDADEVIVLFVPDSPATARGFILYRAVPVLSDGAELLFQRNEELGLPIMLHCMRDANDNILAIGHFADLSLT